MTRECEFGVEKPPGRCIASTVFSSTQSDLPLNQRKAGAWACSMPTVPAAKALLGSTQRPVQLILSIAPLSVASASRSTSATASGVLNAASVPSSLTNSMPFIAKSGQ